MEKTGEEKGTLAKVSALFISILSLIESTIGEM